MAPMNLWQQFRALLRELRAELDPQVIAARLDAWVARHK